MDEVAIFSQMLSKSLGLFGVGLNLSGRATEASRVSYGKNDALGRPKSGSAMLTTVAISSISSNRYTHVFS